MWYAILLFAVAMARSNENSTTPLANRIDKASVKMLKEAYMISEDSNVITSPLGVILLLALYSSGAEDVSKNEIMSLLGSSDQKEFTESFASLGNEFASMDPSYLTLAYKVYVAKGLTLKDEFSNTARSYKSEVEPIDFTDNRAAVDNINHWAAEKTNGHIKEPISEDMIDVNTIVALFNIIFFQGHWHVPFNATETKDKDFHVSKSRTVTKPMMHLDDVNLKYSTDTKLGARLIQLPYKEKGFFMTVILPNEIDGLASVLDKVVEKGLLNTFPSVWDEVPINLYMPKFDIKSKLDYKIILPKLGVQSIFSEEATGVVKESSVMVSEFFQEAIVKVDEEGATASAFTGVVGSFSAQVTTDFIMDHPFLFAIHNEDVILFTGIYSQ